MKDSDFGRYRLENMKNKLAASNNQTARYTPLPMHAEGPKIEVTINQNCETSCKSNDTKSIDRPAFSPPLPPNPSAPPYKFLPGKPNKAVLYTGMAQAVISVILLIGGIWCHCSASYYCPYRTALWTPIIFLINAGIGIATAKTSSLHFYAAHLILSLVAIITATVGGILSYRNWSEMGKSTFSVESHSKDFCVLHRFDGGRLAYMMRLQRYDFEACLYGFKIGVAINFSYMLLGGTLAALCLVSVVLCCKRFCRPLDDSR